MKRPNWLILPFCVWFLFFIVGPLVLVAGVSFARRTPLGEIEADFVWNAYRTLIDPLYFHIVLRTLAFAALNTVFTLLVAYPLAFFLSRQPVSRRTWMLTLILIPFWTSFLIRILAFMDVLRLRPLGLELLYTAPGLLSALVYNYLPFAVLPLFSSLEKIDNSLFEAARDLGANKRQIFARVLWPLSKSGVMAAALFVFIPSLGEFLIPELVGGNQYFMLGAFLQNQFLTARNWPLGSATIVMLVIFTVLVLALLGKVEQERQERKANQQEYA